MLNNDLEKILAYTFLNKEFLNQALCHSSYANEQTGDSFNGNERLEFLGDAVLEEVISAFLYSALPKATEGELSKIRAAIVCEKSLALAAKQKDIPKYIKLGKGEELCGGRNRDSIISDCVEAIFGAVFLDGGREAAKKVIESFLKENINLALCGRLSQDAKSELQEQLQKIGINNIVYNIINETGPAHNRYFEAAVLIGDKEIGRGEGKSKQSAQTQAAIKALSDRIWEK